MKPRTCFVAVYVALGLAATLHAQADCADWNTEAYFEAAEVSDVTRCLQAGMDPDVLPLAALGGGAETVTALLEAGANLEARDEKGLTPLHVWAMIGKEMTGKADVIKHGTLGRTS